MIAYNYQFKTGSNITTVIIFPVKIFVTSDM